MNNLTNVTVIDAVMGSGKSQWAIRDIEKSVNPIMYVTPYLDEVERFTSSISKMVSPFNQEVNGDTKSASLKRLIEKGYNIATTHSLFSLMSDDVLKLIGEKSYDLILDEVIDAYQTYPMTNQDYLLLKEKEYIYIDKITSRIYSNDDETCKYIKKDTYNTGVFYDFFQCVENNMIYEHNNTPIVEYPTKMFRIFNHVTVLTYMFQGSTLKAYFDINKIKYDIKTIPNKNSINENIFDMMAYEMGILTDNLKFTGKEFKHKVEIINKDKLNYLDTDKTSVLSSSWYKKHGRYQSKEIGSKCRSFFRSVCKAKSEECLYTVFKEQLTNLSVPNYSSAFVVMNIRATNKYAKRKYGAYLVNRYIHPIVKGFILSKEADIDENAYALSEMLQWLWRLRIRNGESIKVYIPSKRMRVLLDNWLNN